MENINAVPVQEPENTITPKKKVFGKPEVFMLLALLLGGILNYISSSGMFSALNYFLADILNNSSVISFYGTNFIISTSNNIASVLCTTLAIVIYILFAIFAYKKKLRKSLRFLGVIFFAHQVTNLFVILLNSVVNVVSVYTDGLAYAVIALIFSLGLIAVEAALGVIMLMVAEGKIKSKKEENVNPVQEPENTVKRKEKKFGKPELFMLLTVIIAQFVIPLAIDLLETAFAVAEPYILNLFKVDNGSFYISITGSISSILSAVLIFAVCILFAFLAYKNKRIKNAALFLGVFFAAQSVVQVLVNKPIGFVLNILSGSANALGNELGGFDTGVIVALVSGIAIGFVNPIISFVSMAITAVLAVILLMIAGKKLRLKKKATEEIQENA